MKPNNLNQTEAALWDWLVNNGCAPEEIERNDPNQIPDFHYRDRSYEAKRPIGDNRFTVGERQKEVLDETNPTIAIIGDDGDVRDMFQWEERDEEGWVAKCYDRGTNKVKLNLNDQNRREWEAMRARIDPDASDDEVVGALLDYLNEDESRIDAIRRTLRGPRYRGPS